VTSPDPFTDPVFTSRLQKLLPLLGSGQSGEAEAARRKLLEHLAQHHLSMHDLSQRLQTGAPRAQFSQSAREESLERQLSVARAAKEEASGEARRLGQYLQAMQMEMEQGRHDAGAILQAQGRTRALAVTGWLAAIFCLGLAVFVPKVDVPPPRTVNTDRNFATEGPPTLQADSPADHMTAGQRQGTTAVQDTPIRLGPSDSASIRAFLNIGEHVVILQQTRIGPQTWLLIRSASGTGWARGGDVLR